MTLTAQLWLLDRSGLSPYSKEFLEKEWALIQARIAEQRAVTGTAPDAPRAAAPSPRRRAGG